MKYEIKKLPKNIIELTIEVSVDKLKPYLERAAQRLSLEVKIPGFRPGKAPYEIVKQKIGEAAIYEEAIGDVVKETYFKVVKEENLETIGEPKIEPLKLAPGNPLVYKATVALLPKIELANYRKIRVKRHKVPVEEKKVQKVLEDLRRARRKEVLVDRAAQEGDKVIIDLDILQDNVPIEGGQAKGHTVVIGEPYYIPGFDKKLIGLKGKEVSEFTLPFPNDHYNKRLRGQKIDFKIKMNSVYELTLPKLDSEFVQSLGNFKDLEELKKQIKANLKEEERLKEKQRCEREIFEEIIKRSRFEEIPEVLITSEVDKMLEELNANVSEQGLKFEDYLTSIKKTAEDLRKDFREEAERRVKTALIIREITRFENIEVKEEEIEKETKEALKYYPDDIETQKKITSYAHRDYLREVLKNHKAVEFLKSLIIH